MTVAIARIGVDYIIGDYYNNKMNDCFILKSDARMNPQTGQVEIDEYVLPIFPYGLVGNNDRPIIYFEESELKDLKTVKMIAITSQEYADFLEKKYNNIVGRKIVT